MKHTQTPDHTGGADPANFNSVFPLITVTKELTKIISLETKYLKEKRPQEAQELCFEKNELSQTYQNEMNALAARGGLPSIGKGPIIRELKDVTRVFNVALDKHFKLVKTLKTISENMLSAISDEVNQQNNLSTIYGANAQINNNRTPNPTSLALNHKI
jgi:hypothetical protein